MRIEQLGESFSPSVEYQKAASALQNSQDPILKQVMDYAAKSAKDRAKMVRDVKQKEKEGANRLPNLQRQNLRVLSYILQNWRLDKPPSAKEQFQDNLHNPKKSMQEAEKTPIQDSAQIEGQKNLKRNIDKFKDEIDDANNL